MNAEFPTFLSAYINKSTLRQHCSNCDGLGIVKYSECVDYHRRDYETFTEECKTCLGRGLMLVLKITSNVPSLSRTKTVPFLGNEHLEEEFVGQTEAYYDIRK